MKSPKKCSAIDMVSTASRTKANLNARILKALQEKGINPRAYTYEENMGMPLSTSSYKPLPIVPFPQEGGAIHHWNSQFITRIRITVTIIISYGQYLIIGTYDQ